MRIEIFTLVLILLLLQYKYVLPGTSIPSLFPGAAPNQARGLYFALQQLTAEQQYFYFLLCASYRAQHYVVCVFLYGERLLFGPRI